MFKKSPKTKQFDLFFSPSGMMCERESRLYDAADAWHNKFYQNVTSKIDEDIFKPLYKEGNMGAPNASIRILVAMSILKEGCGCSDEQLYERCRYDLLFRRALGLIGLDEQCPSIDTYYCLRRRICEYDEKHDENLFEKCFKQVTGAQAKEYRISGKTIRMDSKLISSNIAWYSRYEIIHETFLQCVCEAEINRLSDQMIREQALAFLVEDATKTVYSTESDALSKRLLSLGIVISHILAGRPKNEVSLLSRVYHEQYQVESDGTIIVRDKKQVSASSLQNPNDPDATYRKKTGKKVKGYNTNITETIDEQGTPELITDVKVKPANAADNTFVEDAIKATKEVTGNKVETVHADGAYQSEENRKIASDTQDGFDFIANGIQGKPSRFDLNLLQDGRLEVTDKQSSGLIYKILLTLFIMLFLVESASSSSLINKSLFHKLSIKDGLIDNKINCLLQDKKGFLWIGTDRGICKYDGYEFSYPNLDKNNSLLVIRDLYEDNNNNIWVATSKGVSVYNNLSESSRKIDGIDFNIKKIHKSNNDSVTMVSRSNGIIRCSTLNMDYSYIFNDSTTFINDVYIDNDSMWIAASNGLWIKYKNSIKKSELIEGNIVSFLLDKKKNLWIASYRNGLVCIDSKTGKHSYYLDKSGNNYALHINEIIEYDDGQILVGCDNGLILLDYINNSERKIGENFLNSKFIYALLKDRNNGLWIGTYNNGINYISTNDGPFSSLQSYNGGKVVSELLEDDNQNLWIASDDEGLYKYSTNGKDENVCSKVDLSFYNSHALMLDKDKLWVGLYMKGIDIVDTKSAKVVKNINLSEVITKNSVYALCKDHEGDIWAGTLSGLYVLKKNEDRFIHVVNDILPPNANITSIINDKENNTIWIATVKYGLISYKKNNYSWKKYNFSSEDAINTLCLYNGLLTVGTQSMGIYLYNNEEDQFHSIKSTGSMTINRIIGFKEKLWFSSYKNIGLYNITDSSLIIFDMTEGLQSIPYSVNSGIVTKDGRVIFGGVQTLDWFRPDKLNETRSSYKIELTKLKIFYNDVAIEKDSPLSRSIPYSKELCLNHNQRTFSLSFSSMNFFNERKLKYEYKLKGFDKGWIETSHINEARYTNIPPGNYIFMVRIKDVYNNNADPKNTASITIIIKSHPLLSSVAISIYIITVILLIFIFFRYYKKRFRRQQEQLLEESKNKHEKDVFDAKINFFTSITHEIKTPLSLISGPVESLLSDKNLPNNIREDLMMIERNTNKLHELVVELLDFRKIESKAYSIRKETCNLSVLVQDLFIRYEPTCKLKGIEISLDTDEIAQKKIFCNTDSNAAFKVINNILSNAVKYTTDRVEIAYFEDKGTLFLSISDNGIGFDKDNYDNIFKPFVKLNSVPNFSSETGLGLYLVKSLCTLLEWKIEVNSIVGEGTTMTLRIPTISMNDIDVVNISTNTMTITNNDLYTILIVDDNPDMLIFLSKQLENNFNILSCQDATAAFDILKRNRVDFIISDLMMPKLNGIEFCAMVKQNISTCHIPVIILTASENINNKLQSFSKGADVYIEKPVKIELLIAQINSILANIKRRIVSFSNDPDITNNITDENSADYKFISTLNKFIHENIGNAEIDIESMCDEFMMGRTTMFNKIKSLCGVTPKEYVKLLRLKKAAELLKKGDYRINEVGFLVGFNTPSYFSKCFMKQFGVLPGDYLKSKK